ncbi:MAG: bifunctional adenosylcobinamide kinase/adenosylcobinamide-phosphate guanylyltransferase [Ethanoligenens sp.]
MAEKGLAHNCGMTMLITGGAASGKSALAEKLAAVANRGVLGYFATMQIGDEESAARVAKHRQMRSGKGFETVECPFGFPDDRTLSQFDTVLLECISNLTANVMFGADKSPRETVSFILKDVNQLCRIVRQVVIVTNEVFSDGGDYDAFTRGYLSAMGTINQKIARAADVVLESVCGIPVFYKGREVVSAYEALL